MKKSIGIFINKDTHKEYEIFEEINPVTKPSSPNIKVLATKTYTTESDIKAKNIDDELNSFELDESIIYKKNT